MAVTYQQLLHNVAIRMNALVGAQVAALQTTYATAVLTSANFKSADWPFSSFQDAILMGEETYARAIASNLRHPGRGRMAGLTTNVANAGLIPTTDNASNPVIGVYGAIYDATDGVELEEAPLAIVRLRTRNTGGHYLTPVYKYHRLARKLYHTRTNVIVEVCVYNRTTQLAAFAANAAMLLDDTFELPITALAVATMAKGRVQEDRLAKYTEMAGVALVEARTLNQEGDK